MSAFFHHSTRKSWFCIVFYSTSAPWAFLENVLFFCFFCCFCKLLIVISTSCVGHILGHVLVMGKENLDFILFFTAFWSCGHLFKGVIFSDFWSFLCELCVLLSLWAWVPFLVTETENLDFVLFFTAFWGCGHISKQSFFIHVSIFFCCSWPGSGMTGGRSS